jgi:hypothetical protein
MLGSEHLSFPIVSSPNVQRDNGEQILSQPFLRAKDEMNAHCAPLELESLVEDSLMA